MSNKNRSERFDDDFFSPNKAQVLNLKSQTSGPQKASISGSGMLTRFGYSETKQSIQSDENNAVATTSSKGQLIYKVYL